MIRHTAIVPGNDCYYGVCCVSGCEGKRGRAGNGHGIQGEHWFYAVRAGGAYATLSDGEGPALSLEVYTEILPETVPRDHSARCASDVAKASIEIAEEILKQLEQKP